MSKLSYTVSTQRVGNLGYVLEEWSTGDKRVFEMPAHVVPSFLRARREAVERQLTKRGANKVPEAPDYSWLKDYSAKPVP